MPVTTAEVWNIWLEHPELVSAVDYLAVHILPYWEGLPSSVAVDHAMKIYERLRQAYPGKRIVIAEFGWPSAGLNRKDAVPDPLAQAEIIRDFVARADAMGIDYSIVEAFDQPWKTFEGSVGAYWGMFDAERQPKFALDRRGRDAELDAEDRGGARARASPLHPDLRQFPALRRLQAGVFAVHGAMPSAPGARACSTIGRRTISCSARSSR